MSRAIRIPDLSAGNCRDLGDAFYPEEGANRVDEVAMAIRVCRRCPLIRPCREYATAAGETNGVWGGRDFQVFTRVAINRRRRPQPTPPDITTGDTKIMTSRTQADIWAVAARTHQLIAQLEYDSTEVDAGTLLLAFLSELSSRQDIDLLSKVFGDLDAAERRAEADAAAQIAAAERRQAAVSAAINVDCPKCDQAAGSACRGPRNRELATPHEMRVRALSTGHDQ